MSIGKVSCLWVLYYFVFFSFYAVYVLWFVNLCKSCLEKKCLDAAPGRENFTKKGWKKREERDLFYVCFCQIRQKWSNGLKFCTGGLYDMQNLKIIADDL